MLALCNVSALCGTKIQTAPQKGFLKIHTVAKIKCGRRNTKKEELNEDLMRQSEKLFQDGWSFPRNDSFVRGNQIEFTSVSAERHLESSGRQEARLEVALEFEDSFHQAGLLGAQKNM